MGYSLGKCCLMLVYRYMQIIKVCPKLEVTSVQEASQQPLYSNRPQGMHNKTIRIRSSQIANHYKVIKYLYTYLQRNQLQSTSSVKYFISI